ncbi:MAG: beta-glucuronidase, partial [Chitinophagaceae bacterium]
MLKLKVRVFIIFFTLFSSVCFAQVSSIQNIQARKITSLNGKWNYIVDPYENGYYDYRHDPYDQSKTATGGFFDDKEQKDKSELIEYNFDGSPQMNVPGDWNSQSEKLELYEGTIWLRRKFDAQPQKGKRYFVYFGAVNYEAHVYLNGKKIGIHKGGFTPFQFEVTGKLKSGSNSLVVKADNTRKPDEIPTVNTDWWNYGGITRDVYLAELPEHFISDYKLQLEKGSNTSISFSLKLADAFAGQEISVTIPELNLKKDYKTDSEGKISEVFIWNNLSLWSPENPKLYTVNIKSANESIEDKIGFRTIEVKGDSILLNGKSVFFRGISMHDENPLIKGRLRSQG